MFTLDTKRQRSSRTCNVRRCTNTRSLLPRAWSTKEGERSSPARLKSVLVLPGGARHAQGLFSGDCKRSAGRTTDTFGSSGRAQSHATTLRSTIFIAKKSALKLPKASTMPIFAYRHDRMDMRARSIADCSRKCFHLLFFSLSSKSGFSSVVIK